MDDHHERRSIVERSKISHDRSVNPEIRQEDATRLTESSNPYKSVRAPQVRQEHQGAPTFEPPHKGEAHEQA